jgi:hypothetical protein
MNSLAFLNYALPLFPSSMIMPRRGREPPGSQGHGCDLDRGLSRDHQQRCGRGSSWRPVRIMVTLARDACHAISGAREPVGCRLHHSASNVTGTSRSGRQLSSRRGEVAWGEGYASVFPLILSGRRVNPHHLNSQRGSHRLVEVLVAGHERTIPSPSKNRLFSRSSQT